MITIVFGKPGAGKTAYMVSDAVRYMNLSADSRDLFNECRMQVEELNAAGADFLLPEMPPIYSNFPIRVRAGATVKESYYIDGFHLGFENAYVDVFPVFPSSRIYLSEAQRYYNSRKSKDLPDWVSRFYEEHRHFGLEIFLDCQRPGLIDLNIRELCGQFIEVVGLDHQTDRQGNITASRFTLRLFDAWSAVDRYLTSGQETYREQTVTFLGCVFEHYQSASYFNQFVPTGTDFSHFTHPSSVDSLTDADRAKQLYAQTPPPGYYGERKK